MPDQTPPTPGPQGAAQEMTPRTDLAEKVGFTSDTCNYVHMDFARELERELAQAHAEIAEMVITPASAAEIYKADCIKKVKWIDTLQTELSTATRRAERAEGELAEVDRVNRSLTAQLRAYYVDPSKISNMELAMGNHAREDYAALHADFRAVRDQLAAARADGDRLDWLEKNGRKVHHAIGYGKDVDGWTYDDRERGTVCTDTLRQAIDQARDHAPRGAGR